MREDNTKGKKEGVMKRVRQKGGVNSGGVTKERQNGENWTRGKR